MSSEQGGYPASSIDRAILRRYERKLRKTMEPGETPLTYDVAWEGKVLGAEMDVVVTSRAVYLMRGGWLTRTATRIALTDVLRLVGDSERTIALTTRVSERTGGPPWLLDLKHPEQGVVKCIRAQWASVHGKEPPTG